MKYLGPPQSGSQANTTASHNRAGQYLRNRRTPVSPTRTPKQGILRGKFGSASAAWQSLATAAQSAWTSFAHAYQVVDSLGQSIVLTGQQYFIGIQTSLMNAGQVMNLNVPTNTSTPPIDTPAVYAGTNGLVLVTVASVTGGDFNLIGLSKILSNGVNFNKAFSQFAVLNSTQFYVDVGPSYAAQYGHPVAGKKIFARFKEVNSSGMSGPDLILQTPVTTETNTDTIVLSPAVPSGVGAVITGSTSTHCAFVNVATGVIEDIEAVVGGLASYTGEASGNSYYAVGMVVDPTVAPFANQFINGSVRSNTAVST